MLSQNISESCDPCFPKINSRSRQRQGVESHRRTMQADKSEVTKYLLRLLEKVCSGHASAVINLRTSPLRNLKRDRQSDSSRALKLKQKSEFDKRLVR
jgi:hypothetical protein